MTFKLQQVSSDTVDLRSLAWDLDVAPEAISDFYAQQVVHNTGVPPVVIGSTRGARGGPVFIDFRSEGAPCFSICQGYKIAAKHAYRNGVIVVTQAFDILTQSPGSDPVLWDTSGVNKMTPILGAQLAVDGAQLVVPCRIQGRTALVQLTLNDSAKTAMVTAQPNLNGADFPNGAETPPYVDRVALSGGRLFIQTCGRQTRPRTGFPFGVIAEITPDAQVSKRLHWHDYGAETDGKPRGFGGRFTTSGRYFLHNGTYKTTDPWRGEQIAFDLESRDFHAFGPNQALSGVAIFDHAMDMWWGISTLAPHTVRFHRYRAA